MAFAVSAWFDPAFEQAVRTVWGALRADGVSAFLADGPYRPHVTLGVWHRMDLAASQDRLDRLAGERAAFALRFEQFGAFPGPEPGLLLVPAPNGALRELHAAVHGALGGVAEGLRAYDRRDRWSPHCTLARELERGALGRALDVAVRTLELPVLGTVDRIGLIDTPAEVELGCMRLRPAAG